MKIEDINKTGFVTPNGQWVYRRMGQGLKGAPFTYSQFSDLVFGPLPPNDAGIPRAKTVFGDHGQHAFDVFMDDHAAAGTDYESLFKFLHEIYFPRCVFGPVYLAPSKTYMFSDSITLLGFHGSQAGLRPARKHQDKILNWPIPTSRDELDAFLWLTPFLRIFIPGRAELVMRMKTSYLMQVPDEPKEKKPHHDELEECDEDLTRPARRTKPRKPTIRRKWVEKESFEWNQDHQEAFDLVKHAIGTNAMAGPDPDVQYHLATDASEMTVGGCLFQLHGVPPGTEATHRVLPNERINMFLSFKLVDSETRYSNSERECLAIVKCLTEVRWLVVGSPYPVLIYSDHEALKSIFNTGQTEKSIITTFLDRLGEFDWKLSHRPSNDQHIGIADGLSRMPTRLVQHSDVELKERLAMPVLEVPLEENVSLPDVYRVTKPLDILSVGGLEKYTNSPMYHQLIDYLMGGEAKLDAMNLARNRKKTIRHKAKSYLMPSHRDSQKLRYIEANGSTSICIIEEEVPRFLKAAHEDHGHYAAALTLDFLIGRAYWPTRTKDIYNWCASCNACQSRLRRPINCPRKTIQVFEPMTMLGADWVGPITPACEATGNKYILLFVDYFSRFTWAKPYREHGAAEVVDMIENHITPVFGYMKGLYTDNGSHFANKKLGSLLLEHGVSQFLGPISHPQSTGLLERAVQQMLALVSKKCLELNSNRNWSLLVNHCVIDMNTKATKIHGYSPATLMIGIEPKRFHIDLDQGEMPLPLDANEPMPEHQYALFMALRGENRILASETASYLEPNPSKISRKQRIPEVGDLVLVRNHQKDKQHGKKLEAKWLGPRMLVRWTNDKLSGWVRELHGAGNPKRYHLDDMVMYYEREKVFLGSVQLAFPFAGSTPVVQSNFRLLSQAGRRALLL